MRLAFATGAAPTATRRSALAQKYHDAGRGRAHLRAGLHAQPDACCATSASRATTPSSFERLASRVLLSRRVAARRRRRSLAQQHARPGGPVGARHLRRPADPARRASSRTTTCRSCARCCGRRSTGGCKGLTADVVILNEHPISYLDEMHEQLDGAGRERAVGAGRTPGGVFLLRGDGMADGRPRAARGGRARGPHRRPRRARRSSSTGRAPAPTGCRPGRSRRRIVWTTAQPASSCPPLHDDQRPRRLQPRTGASTSSCSTATRRRPLPWANVLANPRLRHDRDGLGLRLHLVEQQPREPADAVRERSGDRSDGRGDLPARRGERRGLGRDAGPLRAIAATAAWVMRHRAGRHDASQRTAGICASELEVFVRPAEPVKASSARPSPTRRQRAAPPQRATPTTSGCSGRRGRATSCTSSPSATRRPGALVARNPYNHEFATASPSRAASEPVRSTTGDRTEFLGRNGSLARRPALDARARCSDRFGAGLDPCARAARDASTLARARRGSSCFLLGAGQRRSSRRARWCGRYGTRRRAPSSRAGGRRAAGARRSARSRSRRRTTPST